MSASQVPTRLSVAAIGGSGPRSTAVQFVKDEQGQRPWAWVANDIASGIVPGMVLIVPQISTGKVESTYTVKETGEVVALKVPRVQLFLGGDIVIDAPDSEPMDEVTFTATPAADAYRKAYLASRAQAEAGTTGEVEPM